MDPINNDQEMNDSQALLTAYALGELQGEELAQVEALLAKDPAAMAEVEAIRQVGKQLEEALAAEGQGHAARLMPDQLEAIHSKAGEAPAATSGKAIAGTIRPWVWWSAGSAAAALFAIAVLLPATGSARRSARQMTHSPDVAMVDQSRDVRQPRHTDAEQPTDQDAQALKYSGNKADEKKQNEAAARGVALAGDTYVQPAAAPAPVNRAREGTENKDMLFNQTGRGGGGPAGQSAPATKSDGLPASVVWNDKAQIAQKPSGGYVSGLEPPQSRTPVTQSEKYAFEETTPISGKVTAFDRSDMQREASNLGLRDERRIMPMPVPVERQGNAEAYDSITDNPYLNVKGNPLSTFSIDVDTASYANIRRFLSQNQLPPAGAVRIEEMVNYFPYEYSGPADNKTPFAVHVEVGSTPWAQEHRLVKIGIKGKDIVAENKPVTNIVFLIDVSGSMSSRDKLPLLREGMKLLVNKMDETDHVAIVVYAGAAGMVLDTTSGAEKETILKAIDNLNSGGSTNGGAGIRLAYDLAQKHFLKEGVNRVILASDGDFNVGTTSQDELVKLIEDKRKSGVFLSVLGFGSGNLKDSTMEKLANKGNGNYSYIDSIREAQKVLVEQGAGTLYTIAKDVKIQVEFNPAKVQSYRLIGYENRLLAKEDFNDDTKDAGEIGAGHTVTALYEVVPVGVKDPSVPDVDPLKYQPSPAGDEAKKVVVDVPVSNELLTVKLRYKQPDGDVSTKLDVPVIDTGKNWQEASQDFKFAAGVAQFGMLLRSSPYKGTSDYAQVLDLAQSGVGQDEKGYRHEFIQLVEKARSMSEVKPVELQR